MQSKIDYNRQDSDKKIKNYYSKLDELMEAIENMMSQNQKSNALPDDDGFTQSPRILPLRSWTTRSLCHRKVDILQILGGMRNLNYEIITPKFYELSHQDRNKKRQ